MPLLRAICFFFLLCPVNIFGIWWAIGSPLDLIMDADHICRKSRRLGGKQREICREEPELVHEVIYGTRVALNVCQVEFQNRKWNCASETQSQWRSIVKTLQLDTRESAYLNAISFAGVMYAITRACTSGSLDQCSCQRKKSHNNTNTAWKWEGCSDNIRFGYRKSKHFLNLAADPSASDISLKLQLHNKIAGRMAIKENILKDKYCKCHGLSGTCASKVCWDRMPTLKTVGEILKQKFDAASKVTISNDGNKIIPVRENYGFNNNGRSRGRVKKPRKKDLVYAADSPNYCEPDKKVGSLGTVGRSCDPKSEGTNGCALLCCGRGYNNHTVIEVENCNCKFQYCCEVICDTCHVYKTTFTCK